ncbi:hypothetical protein [Micromonospora citrea]|nr:hypothetical protein [Micromonospora citrea]
MIAADRFRVLGDQAGREVPSIRAPELSRASICATNRLRAPVS